MDRWLQFGGNKTGVAIGYDRNPKTDIALRNAGYTILHATRFFCVMLKNKTIDVDR